MNCTYHPERNAVHRCNKCGELLCQECAVIVEGKVACKSCISQMLNRREEPAYVERHVVSRRRPSFLLTILLAGCIPGTGQMYLGFMKRGLFLMSAFFLSIVCTAFSGGLFWPLIPIIYLGSIFDALNLRSRMIAGEEIEDSVSGIMSYLYRYRLPVLIFSVLVVCSGWLSRIVRILNRMFGYPLSNSDFSFMIVSVAVIGFGVYIFTKGKNAGDGHQ